MIEQIQESNRNGERFCFILGSGASVESGIPSGTTLEMAWMNCIMGAEADGDTPPKSLPDLEKTARALETEKRLSHTFDQIKAAWEKARKEGKPIPSEYYFDIYKLRFYPNKRNGYRYMERLMEPCEPSVGYHTLALMLTENNQNNLVITTNFDSLVEDALFLYTMKKPLVVNHESLAGYIESDIQRPIVAKVHRGLMYEPFNSPDTTDKLQKEWRETLGYALNTYTPIVIGYGGGDHSLMDYLKEEQTVLRHGIYWCYRKAGELPEEDVLKFLEEKDGYLVGIGGFDDLMLRIGKALFPNTTGPGAAGTLLQNQCNKRIQRYSDQWKKLEENPDAQDIVQSINVEEEKAEEKREQENKLTVWDYRNRGFRAYNEGDYHKAVEEYTRAIELDGNNANDYAWRAAAYEKLGEHQKSIDDYTKAIDLDPKVAAAYNNRGNAYIKLGEYEKAIADCTAAIDLDPKAAAAYNNRGLAYRKLGESEKAIEDYDRAIALEPKYAITYYNRGSAYGSHGESEKAIEDYDRAIALDPKDAITYDNRGFAYDSLGESEKAIKDYTTAITLDPKYANPHRHRGSAYYCLKEYQKALDDLTEAIRLNPKYKDAYLDRARVYRALGREEEARADEEQASKL